MTKEIYFSFLILIFSISSGYSQKTLKNTDPISIYNQAYELYENEKYSSAIERFTEYKTVGENELLISNSDLYIAMSAKELKLKNTEELFIHYLEVHPDQARKQFVYFQLGKYTFDKRKYDLCLDWLKKIEYPKTFDLVILQEYYFMKGYSNYKEENFDKSVSAFSNIDKYQNPYFNIANYYTGYIHYKQNEYNKALEKFVRIKGQHKFERIMPVYITHIYLNLGNYNKAIEYGKNALSTPRIQKEKEIKSYLAEAYFYQKDYNESIKYYNELKELGFKFKDSDYYHYGYALFKLGKFKESIPAFSQINLKKDELGQNIAYLMGTAYLQTKELLKARNSFGFASKMNFDKVIEETSLLNYAKLSYELNFHIESINSLKEFIKKYPASESADEAKSLISSILLSTSNYREAIEIIESISDRNREIELAYQKVLYYYGLEFYQNHHFLKARNLFIKSINNSVNQRFKALSYFWLGESYYQLGDYKKSLRESKNFLYISEAEKTPYFSIAYYNCGYSYFKQEDYEKAKIYFDKYLNLERSNKPTNRLYDVLVRLADCYFSLKQYDNAKKYYDLTISKSNKEVDYALFQEATILGLQKNDVEKQRSLELLIRKYSNSPFVDDATFEIANMYYIKGNYKTAKDKFHELIKEHPKSPYLTSALFKTALSNLNLGNENMALQQFKNIIKNYPYSAEAKEATNAAKDIYIDKGKANELFEFLKTIPQVSLTKSFQDSTVYNAAFSYIKQSKYAEAIPKFENYLNKFPYGYFKVNANYYLASCAKYIGQKEKALTHYEKVNEMSPNEFVEKSLKASAQLYFEKKSFENAAKRFSQLEDIAVKRENILLANMGLMRSAFKINNYEDCIETADKVLKLTYSSKENKIEANYYKGKSLYETKRYNNASVSLRQVYEKNYGDLGAEAKYLSALILFISEEYDNTIDEIIELKNDYQGNDYYIAKGFILLSDVFIKMGDNFQAKHTLESIINNYKEGKIKEIAKQKLQQIIEDEKKEEMQKNNEEFFEMDSDSIK
ncbi:MAG: tetratricopeptide repeat protein [Bacteroidota bacterium]|nr:tetratricopeptide repeat protein [Bacteroidota bacterium]